MINFNISFLRTPLRDATEGRGSEFTSFAHVASPSVFLLHDSSDCRKYHFKSFLSHFLFQISRSISGTQQSDSHLPLAHVCPSSSSHIYYNFICSCSSSCCGMFLSYLNDCKHTFSHSFSHSHYRLTQRQTMPLHQWHLLQWWRQRLMVLDLSMAPQLLCPVVRFCLSREQGCTRFWNLCIFFCLQLIRRRHMVPPCLSLTCLLLTTKLSVWWKTLEPFFIR